MAIRKRSRNRSAKFLVACSEPYGNADSPVLDRPNRRLPHQPPDDDVASSRLHRDRGRPGRVGQRTTRLGRVLEHNAGAYGNIASYVPILPAMGNHENYGGPDGGGGYNATTANAAAARYRTYFETPDNGSGNPTVQDRYYRVDYGPITYITLDCTNGLPNDSDKDTNWLSRGHGGPGAGLQPRLGPVPVARTAARRRPGQKPIHVRPVPPRPLLGRSARLQPRHRRTEQRRRQSVGCADAGAVAAVRAVRRRRCFLRARRDGRALGRRRASTFSTPAAPATGFAVRTWARTGMYASPATIRTRSSSPHLDAPEVWDGDRLVDGGKHYGHLEVNVTEGDHGEFQATIEPVYVFPLMDEDGNVLRDAHGEVLYQRRVYDDVTVLVDPGRARRRQRRRGGQRARTPRSWGRTGSRRARPRGTTATSTATATSTDADAAILAAHWNEHRGESRIRARAHRPSRCWPRACQRLLAVRRRARVGLTRSAPSPFTPRKQRSFAERKVALGCEGWSARPCALRAAAGKLPLAPATPVALRPGRRYNPWPTPRGVARCVGRFSPRPSILGFHHVPRLRRSGGGLFRRAGAAGRRCARFWKTSCAARTCRRRGSGGGRALSSCSAARAPQRPDPRVLACPGPRTRTPMGRGCRCIGAIETGTPAGRHAGPDGRRRHSPRPGLRHLGVRLVPRLPAVSRRHRAGPAGSRRRRARGRQAPALLQPPGLHRGDGRSGGRGAGQRSPEPRRGGAKIVFTAHSLPLAMARRCPYEAQLREACRLVAERVGGGDWRLAYQSRSGRPSEPWLEPEIGSEIVRLRARRAARATW